MTLYPNPPVWNRQCRPTDDELLHWLDECLRESVDGFGHDLSDSELEAAISAEQQNRLTPAEQEILLNAFAEKKNPLDAAARSRGTSRWSALANALRENPSKRLVAVTADLIEFGGFGNRAELDPQFAMMADRVAEHRAWIIERLRDAYPSVSEKLLLDAASRLVQDFTEINAPLSHLNTEVRDKSRMRLPHLIRSVRTNTWR